MIVLKKIWENIGNLGVSKAKDQENIDNYRSQNHIMAIITVAVFCVFIVCIIINDPIGQVLALTVTIVNASFLGLNALGKFKLGFQLGIYFFIILLNTLNVLYGDSINIAITLPLIITMSIMHMKSTKEHVFVFVLTIFMYYFSNYFLIDYYGSISSASSSSTKVANHAIIWVIIICTFLNVRLTVNKNRILDKENKGLINELKNKNDQLQLNQEEILSQNKELKSFAYVASHDLKSPLRQINSFVRLIEKKLKSNDDESIKEYFSFVKDNTKRMNSLIDDILQLSTHSKEATKSIVDLNHIIFNILNTSSIVSNNKNCQVLVDALPNIEMIDSQAHSLFQNLIENGLKYNETEKPIIRIIYEDTTENHIFKVVDNGIGINPKDNAIIFEMFSRLHSSSEYEGTGIGLAICKKIVSNHNGKIWLESAVNEGSSFFVSIPKNTSHK